MLFFWHIVYPLKAPFPLLVTGTDCAKNKNHAHSLLLAQGESICDLRSLTQNLWLDGIIMEEIWMYTAPNHFLSGYHCMGKFPHTR